MSRESEHSVASGTEYVEVRGIVGEWALSDAARSYWPEQGRAWVLRTKRRRWYSLRRRCVVFPHPLSLHSAREAGEWERIARVVEAEYASGSNFGAWFGGIVSSAFIGSVVAALIATFTGLELDWQHFGAFLVASATVFAALALVLVFAFGRDAAAVFKHAPLWRARADAYARRRRELSAAQPTDLCCTSRRVSQWLTRVIDKSYSGNCFQAVTSTEAIPWTSPTHEISDAGVALSAMPGIQP